MRYGFDLGLGRSPGGGHSSPLQYSSPENSMDREAWRARVLRVTENGTRLKSSMHTRNMTLTVFTISKRNALRRISTLTVFCQRHHHPSPELASSCRTGDLSLLTLPPQPLPLGPCTFGLSDYDDSGYLIFNTSGIMQLLSFGDWIISLSVMSLRFCCVASCARISSLFKTGQYSTAGIYHILFY